MVDAGNVPEVAGGFVIIADPILGPHPDSTLLIFAERIQLVIIQGIGVVVKLLKLHKVSAIVPVQAVVGTDPQKTLTVMEQAGDDPKRQTVLLPNMTKFKMNRPLLSLNSSAQTH